MTEIGPPVTATATTALDSPLKLPSGATIKNRLAKAAMSEQLGDLRTGAPTEDLERLYARWSKGGTGLLITGNVMIDARSLGEPRNVIVEDEGHRAALERWARAAKHDGTTAIVQINHPGRQTPTGLSDRVVAPSAIPIAYRGAFPKPRALTDAEIVELIGRYAATAKTVVAAGFDGVQLHAAHGYLISQFLSPRANRRTDGWGGDAERRRRFLLEIAISVRDAIGPGRILAVKLNSADFQRGGFSEDESLDVIRRLDELGIDLLEISGGTYEAPAMTGTMRATTREREAYFLEFAERVREIASMPLMVTGGFRSGAAMDDALASGAIDLAGLARPLALEPELPQAVLANRAAKSALKPQSVGIRKLDGAADLWWTQHQLHRLGAGKNPDPSFGPRRAALKALTHDGLNSLRRRRG
jgi:2,4-dienoyl-CoA reductase-like NADH-dependent reductase (Old Yellow Enzyme family)